MESTPVFRARSVEDVLHLLPTLFGFVPRESLVAITLEGERCRFGFRLRVDLPPVSDSREALQDLARVVVGHLHATGGQAWALVAVSADADRARRAIAATRSLLDPTRVRLAVWATEDEWWQWGDTRSHPWAADAAHPAVVAAVSEGMVIRPDRSAVAAEFDSVHDGDTCGCRRRGARLDAAAPASTARIEEHRAGWSRGGELRPAQAHEIGTALRDVAVRDQWWWQISRASARVDLTWWTVVARGLCGNLRLAPLCLAAFAAWQAGDGVRARLATEAALAESGTYSMAVLLRDVLDAAIPPDHWAIVQATSGPTG